MIILEIEWLLLKLWKISWLTNSEIQNPEYQLSLKSNHPKSLKYFSLEVNPTLFGLFVKKLSSSIRIYDFFLTLETRSHYLWCAMGKSKGPTQ